MRACPRVMVLWAACAAIAQSASAAPEIPEPTQDVLVAAVEEAPPAFARPVARVAPVRASSPIQRIPRITAELVLGGASAAGMAYGGFQLGCALSDASIGSPGCATAGFYGGVTGFSLGIPIGVMLGGALLDGDGAVAPTILGAGLGLAAMVGALVWIKGNAPDVNPTPLVALPLVLAVIGYELSSHDSRSAAQAEAKGRRTALLVVPSAAIVRDGFVLEVLVSLP